uniref:transcriptional protein SWT1 isoform X2 n=1 Tax=Myxine glutinosa TaxID=7769 RepID=UPI00358E66D6
MAKRSWCEAPRSVEPFTSDRHRAIVDAAKKRAKHVLSELSGVSRKKQVSVPTGMYGPLEKTNQKCATSKVRACGEVDSCSIPSSNLSKTHCSQKESDYFDTQSCLASRKLPEASLTAQTHLFHKTSPPALEKVSSCDANTYSKQVVKKSLCSEMKVSFKVKCRSEKNKLGTGSIYKKSSLNTENQKAALHLNDTYHNHTKKYVLKHSKVKTGCTAVMSACTKLDNEVATLHFSLPPSSQASQPGASVIATVPSHSRSHHKPGKHGQFVDYSRQNVEHFKDGNETEQDDANRTMRKKRNRKTGILRPFSLQEQGLAKRNRKINKNMKKQNNIEQKYKIGGKEASWIKSDASSVQPYSQHGNEGCFLTAERDWERRFRKHNEVAIPQFSLPPSSQASQPGASVIATAPSHSRSQYHKQGKRGQFVDDSRQNIEHFKDDNETEQDDTNSTMRKKRNRHMKKQNNIEQKYKIGGKEGIWIKSDASSVQSYGQHSNEGCFKTETDRKRTFEMGHHHLGYGFDGGACGVGRCTKQKDLIEKGENCEMSMEVDNPIDDPLVDQVTARKTVVVLDTNIMLHHLDLLHKLAWQNSDASSPTLLIPWIVLQELDCLKAERKDSRASKITRFSNDLSDRCIKAKDAVLFLNNALKAKAPALLGQSAQQAGEPIRGLLMECNDDRILQCCLQKQRDHAESRIFLWSNDVNLCTKALVSGIEVCKAEDLSIGIEVCKAEDLSNLSSMTKAAVPSSVVTRAGEKTERKPNLAMPKPDAQCWVDISETLKQLQKTMTDVLTVVMEKEMRLAFDEDWLEVVLIQPPWDLQALLKCLDKHWIAVFGFFLPRELQCTVTDLRFTLKTGGKASGGQAILNILNGSLSLLEAFGIRSDYNGILPQAHEKLTRLLRESQKAQNNSSTGSHLSSNQPTHLIALSQPQGDLTNTHVAGGSDPWVVFEEIWAALLNLTSHLSAATYDSTQVPFEHLHSLTCAVNSLLLSLHRFVSLNGRV